MEKEQLKEALAEHAADERKKDNFAKLIVLAVVLVMLGFVLTRVFA